MKSYEADRINPKIDQWNGDVKKINDFQYKIFYCSLYAGRVFTVKYFLFQGKTKQKNKTHTHVDYNWQIVIQV